MSEQRILLHVGAPKTGTSFVQDILFTHRDALRERGILYPADRHDAHFLAALDLMELPWGGLEREAAGRWDRLAAEAREWPGTVIISHEILGRASRLQAARALESLGAPEREVHVVFSARDLVRQIPAEWQENVKHRRTKRYGEFLDDLRDPARSAEVAQWFWGVQEVPDVLDRWGASIPREHVHLVTVPPPGRAHAAVGALRRAVRPRPDGVHPDRARQRLARRRRVDDGAAAEHPAQQRARRLRLPPLRARDRGAPEPRPRRDLGPALAAAGRPRLGVRPSRARGSASSRCAGTTSSATSTT